MIKVCNNCQQEKDLNVWYGHTKGYICNNCAASVYHQEYCYNKKQITDLKDKLHRRNMMIKDLKAKKKKDLILTNEDILDLKKFKEINICHSEGNTRISLI